MGIEEYNLLKSTLEEVSNLYKKGRSTSEQYMDLKKMSTLLEEELKEKPTIDEMRTKITEVTTVTKTEFKWRYGWMFSWLLLSVGIVIMMWALFSGEERWALFCMSGCGVMCFGFFGILTMSDSDSVVFQKRHDAKEELSELRRSLRRIEQLPGLIAASEEELRTLRLGQDRRWNMIEDKMASISHLIPYSDFLPEK